MRTRSQRVEVIVDNRVRVLGLPERLTNELKAEFEYKNPDFGRNKALGFPTYNISQKIGMWFDVKRGTSFPRGGMSRIRDFLRGEGVPFIIRDHRTEGAPVASFPKYRGHTMRWYQEEAIETCLRKEQCIIRMPTAAGKTSMAFALIARIGLPAIVILPTGGLFKQWSERAVKEFGLRKTQLGMIRGQKRSLRPITIAMQKTLAVSDVPDDVYDFPGVVIIDEAQLLSAVSFLEVVDKFPARYRIAISADERRKDSKEFLAYDMCSEVAYEVSRERLEKDGSVLDVVIRVIPTEFRADWYGLPSDEDPEKRVDWKRFLDELTTDQKRNDLLLRFVHEEVKKGKQAIMLTARREHARTLDRFFVENTIRSGYLLGEQDGGDRKDFEHTIAGIQSGEVRVGVGTYGAIGFGIDLPAVAVGAAATPIAGNDQVFNQVRGRLCRTNPKAEKKCGELFYPFDQYVYPGHLKKILAKNKSVVVWDRGSWTDGRNYARRT